MIDVSDTFCCVVITCDIDIVSCVLLYMDTLVYPMYCIILILMFMYGVVLPMTLMCYVYDHYYTSMSWVTIIDDFLVMSCILLSCIILIPLLLDTVVMICVTLFF